MKREEAEQVFGMVAAVYDLHPERRGEQAVVWVPALEEMDAEIVMAIVDGYMKGKGPEKMPTLPFFVTEVNVERQRREPPRHHDAPVECEVCDDNGQVYVVERDGMAPCPACKLGKAVEYPLEAVGPWGPDGFWRSQTWAQAGPGAVSVTS